MKKSGMILKKHGALEYFTAESFDKTGLVRHCFTTRRGGVSGGCYSSLNLGVNRGDDEKNVLENYDIICGALGISKEDVILSRQTHSDVVEVVGKGECGNGLFYANKFENADAFVTSERGAALTIFMADCVPILLLDPKKRVIAACHSGWRGTVQRIGEKTVNVMLKRYGCDAGDMLGAIGPSIGPCCFEVDAPVVREFEAAFDFLPRKEYIKECGGGKYHIDLWRANFELLRHAGIPEENISLLGECTVCGGGKYFSHRRDGDMRGSLAAIIELI
ncbi:MAG: peptidoglycan editing factor PgeF [Clostridia bacterium]|nr:peptidoglycan editing factor PgeF [Clostridia bacterium]